MSFDAVKIEQGALQGTRTADGAVAAFKGVPYAAVPVGSLRWRPPQPHPRWEGIRPAAAFGPSCPQAAVAARSLYAGGHENQSEDCLSLNIWSAAADPDERRPVAVFFHLGGFQYGAASVPRYDGEALAREGVVMVTANYRLNRFGFLAHPELSGESESHTSGNYGLLDQIAALQWVQENIAAFGGSPDSVTVIGCSAGSFAISMLMTSPLATGLFHRAIGQSGALLGSIGTSSNFTDQLQDLESAERTGLRVAAAAGASSLAELRALPPEALLQAAIAPYGEIPWHWDGSEHPFYRGSADSAFAILDGAVIPERPLDVYARAAQAKIPLLTGSSAKEGTGCGYLASRSDYERDARLEYGDLLDSFLSVYGAETDAAVRDVSAASFADRMFASGNWTWARLQARVAPTFYYRFDHVPPVPDDGSYVEKDPGAYHSAEVMYAFRNLHVFPWASRQSDRYVSDVVSGYWVNFIRTGDPNGAGLQEWPCLDPRQPQVFRLGEDPVTTDIPDRARLDFWDKYYGRQDIVRS